MRSGLLNNHRARVKREKMSEHASDKRLSSKRVATEWHTLINMITSYLGSGILAMPFAFRESGIFVGLLTLVLIAWGSNSCIRSLVACKYEVIRNTQRYADRFKDMMRRKYPPTMHVDNLSAEERHQRACDTLDYQDLAHLVLGDAGGIAVELTLLFTQMGTGIVYLIFVADNLYNVLEFEKESIILLSAALLICMCMSDSVERMAHFSTVAQVAMLVSISMMVVSALLVRQPFSLEFTDYNWRFGPSFPLFFGIAIYTYEGVGLALPLESAMRDPTKFNRVLHVTYTLSTALAVLFGLCMYGSFGPNTEPVITRNLQQAFDLVEGDKIVVKWHFITLIKCVMSACLLCTYPIMLVPPIKIMENELLSRIETPRSYYVACKAMRALIVCMTALIAASVPHFSHFMGIVGSLGSTLLTFVFPCYMHYRVFGQTLGFRRRHVLLFLSCAALVAGLISAGVSINGIANGGN